MPSRAPVTDHWGERLGIDAARWPDGFFGENLTLDTLDETNVRVGDEFAIGDEVRWWSPARGRHAPSSPGG